MKDTSAELLYAILAVCEDTSKTEAERLAVIKTEVQEFVNNFYIEDPKGEDE